MGRGAHRSLAARPPRDDAAVGEHASCLAKEGLYSKAAAALEQAPLAPPTDATHLELRRLNPDGLASGPMPALAAQPAAPTLNPDVFVSVFRHPPRGSAGGPSGWRMEHYALVTELCVVPDSVEASNLYQVAQAIAAGRVPAFVAPYFAGGRLLGLVKPNGSTRPIVVGEALRRLVGKVLLKAKGEALVGHFAPGRIRDAAAPFPARPPAAQLGVGIKGGAEELGHAVSAALQLHPASDPGPYPGPDPNPNPDAWVCVSVDYTNFFNSISRPAVFRALLNTPQFADLYPFLSMLYSKASPAKLWADLGVQMWDDILSQEGVHQGCTFGSFLACLGLQPILEEVAADMESGFVVAYVDDVKINAPAPVAHAAYMSLRELSRTLLGLEEEPTKGSVIWEGPGDVDVSMFPPTLPGVASRLLVDKHVGVYVGDARPESVAAVKAALQTKLEDKAGLIARLALIDSPQIRIALLRACASARPGFWMRTMSPSLTVDSAAWYDARMREALSDAMLTPLTDHAWRLSTLPCRFGGLGITSALASSDGAHYASWAASWHNIVTMFPQAIPLAAVDLPISTLPFAVALCSAHRSTDSSLTALTDNINQHPLPSCAPSNPSIPSPSELSQRFPRAQKCFAAVVHSARWLDVFDQATPAHRALILSHSHQGANFAFSAVPSSHHGAMLPISYVTAAQRLLRLPLTATAPLHGSTCKCGARIDSYGDHLLSCIHCLHLRTGAWHDAIQHVVMRMARFAGFNVSVDSRRLIAPVYSPHHIPDLSLIHAAPNGGHVLIDVTTTSVTKGTALPAAAQIPGVAAQGAEAVKRRVYGNVTPHRVVPFAVEEGGALGKEALGFLLWCRKRVRADSPSFDLAEMNWSSRGFSNWAFQCLSLANAKGLGHYFTSACSCIQHS